MSPRASRPAAKARQTPRRELHRQVVMLVGFGDAEAERHDIEKRYRGKREACARIVVGDVKHGFIRAGLQPMGPERRVLERALCRQRARRDQPPHLAGRVQLDAHALRDDPARDIDDVDRHAGHRYFASCRDRPAKRSARTISTIVAITIKPDTAAVRTSRLVSICCHRWIGSTSVRSSARKSDTGTLSNDAMNARNAPAPTPRPISGSVTRRNVVQCVAPRLADASSSAESSCTSAAIVVRSTNGTQTTTWPTMRNGIDG